MLDGFGDAVGLEGGAVEIGGGGVFGVFDGSKEAFEGLADGFEGVDEGQVALHFFGVDDGGGEIIGKLLDSFAHGRARFEALGAGAQEVAARFGVQGHDEGEDGAHLVDEVEGFGLVFGGEGGRDKIVGIAHNKNTSVGGLWDRTLGSENTEHAPHLPSRLLRDDLGSIF